MLRLTTLGSSSKGNCHILECDNSSIMLDCGINAKDIVKKINLMKLDGVFITHKHGDHSKGVEKLSLYTNCKYYMNDETFESININERYKEHIFSKQPIETKDFIIMPFDVYHDVQNTNFLILHKQSKTKTLYITDTSDISNLHFKDIDYFIIEGNFSLEWDLSEKKYERTNSDYGHLPIEQTREFLRQNMNEKTKNIFISHISHSFKNIEEFEEIIREITPQSTHIKALNNQTQQAQIFELEG